MNIATDLDAVERLEHPFYPGVYVKVRAIENPRSSSWRKAENNRIKVGRTKHGDHIEQTTQAELLATAGALEGWENVEDDDGVIEFDPEVVRKMARSPKYRRFFEGVRQLVADVGEKNGELQEESLGN